MITIYRADGNHVHSCSDIAELKGGAWINLAAPTQEELDAVQNKLGILPEFLRYPLDEEETSRIERDEGQLLLIIKVPDPRHTDEVVRYETIPLGIILIENTVITICLKETPLIEGLFPAKSAYRILENPARLIFQIFLKTAALYLRHLRYIDRLITEYEAELHRSMRNQELFKLLNLEKSLIYFNTSLRANDLVIVRLQGGRYLTISEDDIDILEDAQIENQQAIEMAKIFSDILSGMMDSYASIISNNLNIVMKFLTVVTIVISIPTLITSIFGMNVPLPMSHHPHAFIMIIASSLILSSLTALWLFRKKMF